MTFKKTKKLRRKKLGIKKRATARCSPKEGDENGYTCFDNSSLQLLKDLWNRKHPSQLIHESGAKEIWSSLSNKLQPTCKKNELCWLNQGFVDKATKERLIDSDFAPIAPKSWEKKPNEWLSNEDIESVLKQYENKYKCFKFIGPTPIDFDKRLRAGKCVWDELCNFNLKSYIDQGIFKIGISFNTKV